MKDDMTSKMTERRRLKVLWSEYKFYVLPFVQAGLTFACYAVGYDMSSASDGLPMARAGALATAISVGFTLWSYGEILARGNRLAKDQFGKAVDGLQLHLTSGGTAKAEFAKKLDAQTSKISRRISLLHTLILVVATLVWGFGDLISKIL